MLLWSEKEQIRLLSQTDPDLWTPEKLSQSFPATPDIIAVIAYVVLFELSFISVKLMVEA